ncbi:MAG TPA: hypothetical protein VEC14_13345 [Reyranellaceae bacterium]|nr:hypothetical protein [Reyranellaceae bacterium]
MLRTAATTEKMRTPATASAVLHASVLAVAFFGLPDLFSRQPPLEPEPVMIEFEAIDKKAAAPVVGNPPPQPKDAPIAEETTKAPPPKSAEPPPTPEPPKPKLEEAVAPPPPMPEPPKIAKPEPPKPQEDVIALKPKEPEPPKVEKPPEPPKPPPPPQVKKPDPPKPPPPQPPKPKTADSLVDDILKNKDPNKTPRTPEQQPKPPQQVTRQPTAAPQLAAVVTASEVEGVRSKIRPCWNTVGGAKEAPIITFIVEMRQDGTPVKAEVRDTGRYNNDPVYRSAADAAWRALMNPRCQPWPLPAEKYARGWRTITFNFDPRDY